MTYLANILASLRPAWWADARCAGADVTMFVGTSARKAERARALCADCPVALDCLADGIDEEYGMRAGYNMENPEERAAAREYAEHAVRIAAR
jgi:hypothetical protein